MTTMSAPSADLSNTLYADPGWLVVDQIEDFIIIVRSWLIRQTDEAYQAVSSFIEGMTLVASETLQTGGTQGWEGGKVIAETWGWKV